MACLTAILEALNKDVLSAHAPLVGAEHRGRKGDVVASIATRILADPTCLVNACGATDRSLLKELVHGPASGVEESRFAAKYGKPPPEMERWSGFRKKHGSVLVLVTEEERPARVFRLASDLREPLKRLLPPPSRVSARTVAELPREHTRSDWRGAVTVPVRVYEGAAHVFEEGRRVLALVQQGRIAVSDSTKRPTATAVQRVAEVLVTPDFELELDVPDRGGEAGPVRAHAWPVILQQFGWAKAVGTTLALTRKGTDCLRNPTADAWREGFARLLTDKDFDELHRIPNIRGQTGRAKRTRTPMPDRRGAITEAMAGWPVGQWLTFDEAFRFGVASGRGFQVNRDLWNLYFCEHGYGCLNVGDDEELACQYLRVLLFETFATLGIVDVAYVPPDWLWPEFSGNWGIDELPFCGRYDGLLHVRLTSLGAYCLGLTSDYQAPKVQGVRLHVLPNRDIVAVDQPELPPAVAALIGNYAKRQSDAVWRLDNQQILAHLEQGGSIADLRDLLAAHGAADLPETVEAFLTEVERRATAIEGGDEALLVRFRDPVTAALIASDATGRTLCTPAGEKALVVLKKNLGAFRTLLRRKGFPPAF